MQKNMLVFCFAVTSNGFCRNTWRTGDFSLQEIWSWSKIKKLMPKIPFLSTIHNLIEKKNLFCHFFTRWRKKWLFHQFLVDAKKFYWYFWHQLLGYQKKTFKYIHIYIVLIPTMLFVRRILECSCFLGTHPR